jgi:hypothetical protein
VFYRRPKRFAQFLSWECFGRSVVAGGVAAAGFAVTLYFSRALTHADLAAALTGLAAGVLDGRFRHPRFFRDFGLIRSLEATHRKGDWHSLMKADLIVWNNQYAFNFLAGLVVTALCVDALTGGIGETTALRGGFLFAACFYWTNAAVWRLLAHARVMRFLAHLKVEYAEHTYG